jgi:hypothetical protein
MLHGKLTHRRSINMKYGHSGIDFLRRHVDPTARVVNGSPKHKYIYPLDKQTRQRLQHLSRPYPKREEQPQ